MFKKTRNKNKRGQNTAEYAILIALVVAAVIAMQTYAQRALQARIRDASNYMAQQTDGLGDTDLQYEPYYSDTMYDVGKTSTEHKRMGSGTASVGRDSDSERTRYSGRSITNYDANETSKW